MKHFIFIVLFVFLFLNAAKTQTNVNISGPENVLVVWNGNSAVSDSVQQYYIQQRNIPSVTNVLRLDSLIDKNITVGGITHTVGIRQETDVIKDINNESWFATEHAWKYFLNYVANPIKEHITNNNLTSTIRYIVLCKGVPFKIQPGGDFGSLICGVTVDGLLCMLNTNNYENFLHSLYTTMRSYAISDSQYYYGSTRQITNPYFSLTNAYGIDQNYTFNYRFKPDHFTTSWGAYPIKLSYLVSHLDGISYEVVEGIIDKSVDADKSGLSTWVIDDDSTMSGSNGYSVYNETKGRLTALGFNVISNKTDNWITSYTGGNVMGFTSWGTHAEDGNCAWDDSAWVVDSLNFNLSNGAVFNTLESFNGNSISTNAWRYVINSPQYGCNHTQGLATQFTAIGGTGTMGHSSEPYLSGIVECRKFFPSYAMGYGMVDAIYQGIRYLAWQNVVVGDPLTTIAWGKQSLTSNLNWSGTNLVTGEIDISDLITLTIADSSTINLRHQGFITGEGQLILGQNVTFNIYRWDKGLFLSYDGPSPRLVWGAHPSLGLNVTYKVYRKIDDDVNWSLIAITSSLEYTDEEMFFYIPQGDESDNVFYMVTAQNELPGTYESNTVSTIASKEKLDKRILTNTDKMEYSLGQNFPNPFNPETKISYTIRESGLVQLKVYDVLGKEVLALVNGKKEAGNYSVNFDASQLPSGVYIYRIQSGEFISSKKMILLK